VADAVLRDLSVLAMLARREVLRFLRSPVRALGGLVQPALFVLVLGYGLNPVVDRIGGVDFRQFVFPGAVAVSVATTALFAAATTVRDRESGFLRQVLVAPVARSAIVAGKVAGAAGVAVLQGALVLALAPLVDLPLTLGLAAKVLAAAAAVGLVMGALGFWVAAAVRRLEGFQGIVQFVLFPMVFLSGALFPLDLLPNWLALLSRLNPLTHAVLPMRRLMLESAPGADPAAFTSAGGFLVLVALGGLFAVGCMWEATRRD